MSNTRLQQWFDLLDVGAEEALFETSFYRDFAGISGTQRIPDCVSILRFRHLLEAHELSPKILQVININAKLVAHGLLLKVTTVVPGASHLLGTQYVGQVLDLWLQ